MTEANVNARLEAFCDGVFAIALTLLIIDVKLPAAQSIANTAELWHALRHLSPEISAFVLSFFVIFVTWVNHHEILKLVHKSSGPFIYANGLLLLTVVFIPFPTALLGMMLLTNHAAPGVVLYNGVLSVQAIGWILLTASALKSRLHKDEAAAVTLRERNRNGYFAFGLYSLLSLAAVWFPVATAGFTMLTWMFWLVLSFRDKHV